MSLYQKIVKNQKNKFKLTTQLPSAGGDGAEIVYALRNDEDLARESLNNISKAGQNVRRYYQRRLPSDPTKDYYFILRETGRTEPLLIEYGFIDSPKDDVGQLQNNLEDYVEGVVKAVADYVGVFYNTPSVSNNTYIVKKGDNLYSIANKLGVSIESLKASNGISGNLINVGQVLTIPSADAVTPNDYLVYTVKKGDSLWNIAGNYGISVNDLVDFNNLGTTFLQVGQQLLIPVVDNGTDNNNSLGITYVVKPGDTLWNIAKKYNISVDEIKNANNLFSNMLSIGQELVIPETSEYKTYVVKSGDSLWKIANDFDVNLNELIALNNLDNDILSIGQTLLIP